MLDDHIKWKDQVIFPAVVLPLASLVVHVRFKRITLLRSAPAAYRRGRRVSLNVVLCLNDYHVSRFALLIVILHEKRQSTCNPSCEVDV